LRSTLLGLAALLSGIAALVWQVLWIRRLSEAFGHGAYAVNTVLAVFFCGLGIGAAWLGRAADERRGSIRLYAALEVLIAVSGFAFGPACDAVERIYLSFAPAEWPLAASLLVKGGASAVLLAVPTIAMGGTLPALLRHAVRTTSELGARVGWLYGANTVGAAIGAAGAVLFLVPGWGVAGATATAAGLNLGAAALAWCGRVRGEGEPARTAGTGPDVRPRRPTALLAAASVSGFVTVGLEVLWTRALAARFLNTVYSFATILTVFLLGLGLASIATAALDRRGLVRRPTLALVFGIGGILGLASVLVLGRIPTSWREGTGASVAGFFLREVGSSVALMALPVFVLGLAFPMIVRLVPSEVGSVGRDSGRVYFVNTIGSVAAPLLVGFEALPAFGLRACIVAVSWLAVLQSVVLAFSRSEGRKRRLGLAAAAPILALAIGSFLPADVRLWRDAPGDRLVDYREGTTTSVAVLDEAGGDRVLKLNNDYVLGGLKGAHLPRREACIPLLLHPAPRRVLFIGLGTGGSAGAAAAWPELRVDALEIVPEVIEMLPWFQASNGGLAELAGSSDRVRLLAVDGRHFVRATPLRYDVVVGDLFLPYRAGEGAMYTREHLDAVRRVLAPGGLFCQWLPLYQFRDADLKVVVRTFCEVFPNVAAFWLHPDPVQPVLGLVGSEAALNLSPASIESRLSRPELRESFAGADLRTPEPLLGGFVAGRETLLRWSAGAPVETRDRPRIEYSAPRNTILSPKDPSAANIAAFLAITEPATADGPFERCPDAERERIAAYQRAYAHLLAAPGSVRALALALQEAPDWELVRTGLKARGRACVESGDFGSAKLAADALERTEEQAHAGLYLEALIARRAGDRTEALRLVREALAKKPDHAASRELLRELESGSDPAAAAPPR
jgi:spermidine synthase